MCNYKHTVIKLPMFFLWGIDIMPIMFEFLSVHKQIQINMFINVWKYEFNDMNNLQGLVTLINILRNMDLGLNISILNYLFFKWRDL